MAVGSRRAKQAGSKVSQLAATALTSLGVTRKLQRRDDVQSLQTSRFEKKKPFKRLQADRGFFKHITVSGPKTIVNPAL